MIEQIRHISRMSSYRSLFYDPNFRLPEFLQMCEDVQAKFTEGDNVRLGYLLCNIIKFYPTMTFEAAHFQNITDVPTINVHPAGLQQAEEYLAKNKSPHVRTNILGHWKARRSPHLENFIVKKGWLDNKNSSGSYFADPTTIILISAKRGEYSRIDKLFNDNGFDSLIFDLKAAICDKVADFRLAVLGYCRCLNSERRLTTASQLIANQEAFNYPEVLEWLAEQKFYPKQDYARVVLSLLNDEFVGHNTETEAVLRVLLNFVQQNK